MPFSYNSKGFYISFYRLTSTELLGVTAVKQHSSFSAAERVIKTLKYECLKHVPGIASVNYRNLISLYLALCLVYDSFS